jgi:hypothetical protein
LKKIKSKQIKIRIARWKRIRREKKVDSETWYVVEGILLMVTDKH